MSSLGAYRRNSYSRFFRGDYSESACLRGIAPALGGSGRVESTPARGKSADDEVVEGDSLTVRDALVARWPVLLTDAEELPYAARVMARIRET